MNIGWFVNGGFLKKKNRTEARASRRRSKSCRKSALGVESLEDRCLLSQGAFLQGFAFVDSNSNGRYDTGEGIGGAAIQLFAADSTTLANYPGSTLSTVLGSSTSAANGYYVLNDGSITVPNTIGLAPGNYLLVETPPAGYSNSGTDILSQVNAASALNSSTIRVTLEAPNALVDHFDGFGPGANDNPHLDGNSEAGFTGQLNIHLTDSSPTTPLTTGQFFSLCLDLTEVVGGGSGFPVLATPTGSSFTNGGEIAYLYNHYGNASLDNAHAEALQEAVWELIYDGRFTPDLSHPGVAAAYNSYLTEAAGKNEAAIFLDATLGGQPGHPVPGHGQSMIATGSLNFSNLLQIGNPSIVTVASAGGVVGSVVLNDTATLSGGVNPTGTVTFTLTAPDHTVAYTETDPVSGDGNYSTHNTTAAPQVGVYTWSAHYSGDLHNNPADDNGVNETATVTPAGPTIITVASAGGVVGAAVLNDTATLSGGVNPTGTVTFTLTAPDHTVVYSETDPVSGDGNYSTQDRKSVV